MDLEGLLSDDEDEIVVFERVFRQRRPKSINIRVDHFNKWDNVDFFKRFRLHKNTANFVISLIKEEISSQTERNQAVSPTEKFLLTLRFYASGNFLINVADLCGVSVSAASNSVKQVSEALARRCRDFVKFPTEIQVNHSGFFAIAKFPKCAGAVDCTHVKIQSPGGDNAETFRNRKQFFSMNVQCVADANLKICDIVARWPGATHDSYIYKNSKVCSRIENGEFGVNSVFVGDSGYSVSPTLITPLGNPTTRGEILFQEAQIRTRNPVERLFGVWKRRFPVLAMGIRLKLSTVEAVIVATAVLHNIATEMGEGVPEVTTEELAAISASENVPIQPPAAGTRRDMHSNRRNALIYYFGHL